MRGESSQVASDSVESNSFMATASCSRRGGAHRCGRRWPRDFASCDAASRTTGAVGELPGILRQRHRHALGHVFGLVRIANHPHRGGIDEVNVPAPNSANAASERRSA